MSEEASSAAKTAEPAPAPSGAAHTTGGGGGGTTATTPEEEVALSEGRFIKVSGTSKPKAVAGKIAHMARQGDPPATMCIGAASINQAIKSICIARQYLAHDNLDLSFQPAFREPDRRPSVALYITKSATGAADAQAATPPGEMAELSVAGNSKPAVLAGALAARVREQKQPVLTAIGVDAVSNAVLAIGNARLFLEQNNLDVRALPEFVTVQKEERELNAVKFVIRVEQVS